MRLLGRGNRERGMKKRVMLALVDVESACTQDLLGSKAKL
jgi:hypothetical protein